ncbi:DUF5666 domain-containing protein [Gordonia sp. DT30]|uniref:DUF5666 domain-containing protein n=1 Tax=unclassified Gordonia (in: high G+C Gram-positive bacteria) TaxID=2657482 RepID=UPI003CF1A638
MSDIEEPREPAHDHPAPGTYPAGDPTTPLPPGPPPTGPQPPTVPQPAKPPFWRTQRTAVLIGIVALVIGGLVGGGIGWAIGHDSTPKRVAAAERSHHGKTPHQGAAAQRRRAVAGQITAINGQAWTVHARNNKTVTVDITGGTHFGTARMPQQQNDFAVGDRIVVTGARRGGTVTARDVVKRPPQPARSQQPSGPPAPTSAQPG